MARKYKYIDKENLKRINYLSLHVLKYNRAIREDVIDALPDDKLFPITFSMIHEHKAGKICEPHIRCIIAVPGEESPYKQLILDMESGLFNLLPEVDLPDPSNNSESDQPSNPTPEPAESAV